MEVKIVAQKENPVLKRKEVHFTVEHTQGKTPQRMDIKRGIASQLQVKETLVFVKKMKTLTGTNTTAGEANAYESDTQAKLIEPGYIVKRNSSPAPEKPKEEAKA
jgi:small subunit ribosomal protein S24e